MRRDHFLKSMAAVAALGFSCIALDMRDRGEERTVARPHAIPG